MPVGMAEKRHCFHAPELHVAIKTAGTRLTARRDKGFVSRFDVHGKVCLRAG
jgi:hypothetical protein